MNNTVKAEEKLSFQILKDKGLIQLPIEYKFGGGAIYKKENKRIPVLNTAQPRVYQYFVAWHEEDESDVSDHESNLYYLKQLKEHILILLER